MKFDTSMDDPEVTFELIDIDGKTHQTHTLKQSALRSE